MPEPTWVRVKDKTTGHKFSVQEISVDEDAMTVLKQDAVGTDGLPLPPEYAEPAGSSTAK